MSATEQKHTPGPWRVDDIGANCLFIKGGVHVESGASASEREYYRNLATITQRDPHPRLDGGIHRNVTMANARLIAAAPELLEVLHECIDAQWVIDSHAVEFDGTVHFGPYYDFSGLDGIDRHEFLAEHSCVVWPSGGKWSAYCTYEGSTWFEAFDSADAAKEACMKLLDKVMPTHPAMKARAAIAKATGATHEQRAKDGAVGSHVATRN